MSNKITVSALINAPLERTWQTWTTPEHITQWNVASDDWRCPSAENDLRVGGTFSSRMAAKDGSAAFDFEGTYTDVKPLEHIAYELGDGRKVSVTFEQVSSHQTRVTEVFDPENVHDEDMQRAGWQAILESFKRHAEAV
ncbi:MAG: SRPBCC family protein [Casimicrobium sp.]